MRAFKLKSKSDVLVLNEGLLAVRNARRDVFPAVVQDSRIYFEEHLVLDPQDRIPEDVMVPCTDPTFAGSLVHPDLRYCRYGLVMEQELAVRVGTQDRLLPVGAVIFAHYDDVEILVDSSRFLVLK